jgi:hypothetical protein
MKDNTNLEMVVTEFPNITNGTYMFSGCSSLVAFNSGKSPDNLGCSNLKYGQYMFDGCTKLKNVYYTSFASVMNGSYMFNGCTSLVTFDNCNGDGYPSPISNLDSLVPAPNMFTSCASLTNFNSSIKSLTQGTGMFHHCTALESFIGKIKITPTTSVDGITIYPSSLQFA